MELRIEIEREDDGRWIAEVIGLPGVMAYGPTRESALLAAKILALRVVADQLESRVLEPDLAKLSFTIV